MNSKSPELRTQIIEEASEWFVEFSEGTADAAACARFDAWLRRSPEHVQAYLQITVLWEDAPLLGKGGRLTADALVAHAVAQSNVVSLNRQSKISSEPEVELTPFATPVSAPSNFEHNARGAPVTIYAVAASLLLLAIGSIWLYVQRDTYSTAIGEQRSIRLDDGSTVDLNSQSKIRVRFGTHQRNIRLLQGQGLFRVAKDPSRPFVVATTDTHVRAVGTQFDVYRKDNATVVTVLEGRVAVLSGSKAVAADSSRTASTDQQQAQALVQRKSRKAGLIDEDTPKGALPDTSLMLEPIPASLAPRAGEMLLVAGEQVTVNPHLASQPQLADLAAATAWTQHKILIRDAPLTEVIGEFNRYNERQIVISDADLGSLRISAVFSSTDADSLIKFLRELPNISVEETPQNIRLSRR